MTTGAVDSESSASCICPVIDIVRNLRREFDFLEYYSGKDMSWKDWRNIYMGDILKNTTRGVSLIPWNDKIWLLEWFKTRGIATVPIIHVSKFDHSVISHITGLSDYVVKPSHTSSSMFMWIVKDGRAATVAQSSKWNGVGSVAQRGAVVRPQEIEASMKIAWSTHTSHEDWPRNNVPPGLIIEKLLPDNTELKYSVAWGKVVGFLVDGNSERYFTNNGLKADGHSVRFLRNGMPEKVGSDIKPPFWWERGLYLAERVAHIAMCDHVRVDLYYFNGEPILNEFTWNPGGEAQDQMDGLVAKTLDIGYEMHRDNASICPCGAIPTL